MVSVPQDLLLNVYSRVNEPQRWGELLDRVCHDLDMRSAVVQRLYSAGDGRAATRWLVRDSYSEENSALHDVVVADAVNPRMDSLQIPHDRRGQRVFRDQDFRNGAAGRRFRESLRSIGLGDFMSAGTKLPNGEGIAVVLHRHVDDRRGFDSGVEDYTLQLAQHLRQALILGDTLDAERRRSAALGSVIDRLRSGVVLCDPSGHVIWASARAHELIDSHPALRIKNGRITGVHAQDVVRIRRLLAGATELADCRAAIGIATGRPLHCTMVPVPCDRGSPDGRIALFLSAPEVTPQLDAEAIADLLGLSPAEARVVAAISEGMNIKEYAAARGLSEGTVRFQLKQALAKTDTRRQADLVRLVYSSLAAELIPNSA